MLDAIKSVTKLPLNHFFFVAIIIEQCILYLININKFILLLYNSGDAYNHLILLLQYIYVCMLKLAQKYELPYTGAHNY